MSDYEHPVYMNEVEAEMLLGLLSADAADEDGHEMHGYWNYIIEQLSKITNG